MDLGGIKTILNNQVVTYARIVVDYQPQEKDPNCVRIIAEGNLIKYHFELTTLTSDIIASKVMWNSISSNRGARYSK